MGELIRVIANPSFVDKLLQQTLIHLSLSGAAVALAILVAVPAGIWLTRAPRLAEPVMTAVGLLQTIPSVALLAFMIPLVGIGTPPALLALFLYALLPILRNTYIGIREVDPAAKEAGRGMGMTSWQMLVMVELPLAFRVMMSGIRVSTVLIIGWATLAAFVGGGGLGDTIMTGFAMVSTGHILAGGIPVTLMALCADFVLGRLEKVVTPRGIRV
ncbi:MAG: glycine betaine/carnitine/choline transporter permease protein [Symbiobacteriaceae bacterium]|jgi:osmoprotectant transport system permease protein|nr:glycine betaine/carnitine/choline transporter permease protein [Symbiobacteriaceae bacterium]